MPRTEVFAFDLKDNVMIKVLQRPGRVEALSIDFMGPRYLTVYWDNSERSTVWLYPDELEAR